jgi:hypothetical protein
VGERRCAPRQDAHAHEWSAQHQGRVYRGPEQ